MSNEKDEVSVEFLDKFAQAWNRHDVNDLMTFMTDDCIFDTSAGLEIFGTRYEGAEAVRQGYTDALEMFPDAHWNVSDHFVSGNRGASQWVFTGTLAGGQKVKVCGLDLFTFRDGKILIKDSYRKNITAA